MESLSLDELPSHDKCMVSWAVRFPVDRCTQEEEASLPDAKTDGMAGPRDGRSLLPVRRARPDLRIWTKLVS